MLSPSGMSQAAADALVARGQRAVPRRAVRARRLRASSARFRCFRTTRSAGRASATRCCAWASRTRPRARSIRRSASRPKARPRCGAARSRTPRSATRSSRRTICAARSRCSRRGSRWRADVPALASFLQVVDARGRAAARAVRSVLDASGSTHAIDESNALEVGRIANLPEFGKFTYVTLGLSNAEWREAERPRVELMLVSTVDTELCAQILANLAFHLADTKFFPEPGTMVRDVVAALAAGDLSERLPHVYVQSPRAVGLDLPLDEGPPRSRSRRCSRSARRNIRRGSRSARSSSSNPSRRSTSPTCAAAKA